MILIKSYRSNPDSGNPPEGMAIKGTCLRNGSAAKNPDQLLFSPFYGDIARRYTGILGQDAKAKNMGGGSFAPLKREHNLSAIRKRGIRAATEECLLSALTLNLKRMVRSIFPDSRKKNRMYFICFAEASG
jgi:hypothetical protein